METFSRRDFLRIGTLGCILAASPFAFAEDKKPRDFKMKFAPRLGMPFFNATVGKDPIKRMRFFRESGFTAIEGAVWISHKPLKDSDIKLQSEIGAEAKRLGLEMGCLSSMNEKDFPTMTANQVPSKTKVVRDKMAIREFLHWQLNNTFDILRRVGATTFIIGPGIVDSKLSAAEQYDNVVENMAFCAEICRINGFVMEIEPLNTTSHPNMYCDRVAKGAQICEDVGSPNCRLLFDLFHEQMQLGNLDALDNPLVWKHLESFHVADTPDRNEPGSGNMPYAKIFKKIWDKGYRGIIGLEHGESVKDAATDAKILKTYRSFDAQV